MAVYAFITVKILSLILALRFFKKIMVFQKPPEYYYKTIRVHRRNLFKFLGLIVLIVGLSFVPFEQFNLSSFFAKKVNEETIEEVENTEPFSQRFTYNPELLYGGWDIEGKLETINFYTGRTMKKGTKRGKWSMTKDTLFIKYDNSRKVEKYIIDELENEYFEMARLSNGSKFNAISLDY